MAKVEPREGVYVFAGAILARRMLTPMHVDRLARRSFAPSSTATHFDL